MHFNEILLKLMQQHGYTNYKLAQLMDISQSTVAYWVDGKGLPQRSKRKQLADIFGVSVDELMGKTKKPAAENGSGEDNLVEEDEVAAKRAEIIRLLDAAPEWLQDQIHSLLKAEESGRTSQGGNLKVQ